MQNRAICLVIIIFIFFISACASTNKSAKKPEFKYIKTTLAKNIDNSGPQEVLIKPATSFSSEDEKIIAHMQFANLSGRHHVRWKWNTPAGRIYCTTKEYPLFASKGKYVKKASAWHMISINGEKAQKYPGRWSVDMYLDGIRVESKNFQIRQAMGLPPMLSIKEISFSENLLDVGETANLELILKNTGPGDAKNVYLEISSNSDGLLFKEKKRIPTVQKKNGLQKIIIPIKGNMNLKTGQAYLDVNVVEPNFRVKIKGKRLIFHTRKFRNPELILAKFATKESESAASNHQIDINEVIDLIIIVQNIGKGTAKDVKVDVLNNQEGVMFLGADTEGHMKYEKPMLATLDTGKYKTIKFSYFVNSDFKENDLKFTIKGTEGFGKYGFSKTKIIAINTELKPEGYIRHVASSEKFIGAAVIQDLPDIIVDVDINIPKTAMQNPDAVAVIIGNRNYKHNDVPTVKYARQDAEIIKQHLIKTLGFKKENIFFEIDATKAKFEALFGIAGDYKGYLYDFVKPHKSDVFIFYSGHGAPDLKTKKGYFMPVDCNPAKVSLNGFPISVLYENLAKLEARSITVALDACFSGGTNEEKKSLIAHASPMLIEVDNPGIAAEKALIMTSSEGDQISSWYNEKQHGLFTYFFLKAIRGSADKNEDNEITFQEIYNYISDNTAGIPYYARRLYSRDQMPTLLGTNKNDVFVRY